MAENPPNRLSPLINKYINYTTERGNINFWNIWYKQKEKALFSKTFWIYYRLSKNQQISETDLKSQLNVQTMRQTIHICLVLQLQQNDTVGISLIKVVTSTRSNMAWILELPVAVLFSQLWANIVGRSRESPWMGLNNYKQITKAH